MTNVLVVSHREQLCGVSQFGRRYYEVFAQSKKYQVYFIDVAEISEFHYWWSELKPAAIVYNFYSGDTMPWCSPELIAAMKKHAKQLCLYHELDLSDKPFDLILHQDPASTDSFPHWKLPRMIPEFPVRQWHNPLSDYVPTFGSFGFGLGGKGFSEIVERVQYEFEDAFIRLHIPFAAFGDADGKGARDCAEDAARRIRKPGIRLLVTHEFKPQNELLEWLAGNDCNCFFYESNYGRGISGVLDYALAVRKPIAITRSHQFKHVWEVDDSFLIEQNSLRDIIKRGVVHLEKFHTRWSNAALVQSFEDALLSLGVT